MPQAPMGQEPKEEGPAEAAPEEEGRPSDLEPLGGYAEQSKKKMQIFEIDGYFRMRSDYLYNFNLGQGYTTMQQPVPPFILRHDRRRRRSPASGLPPFPVPLNCPPPDSVGAKPLAVRHQGSGQRERAPAPGTDAERDRPGARARADRRARQHHHGLDARLAGRDQPQAAGQPARRGARRRFCTRRRIRPRSAQNGYLSSIRAKRAWGEVDSEFGSLRFGRMPWHFGRGIAYNDGNCPDCDLGTTVDRLMALTQLYGHQFALAWDFGAQGLTSQQLNIGRNDPGGYPIDLSQDDDVVAVHGGGHPHRLAGGAARAHRSRRHGGELRAAAGLPQPAGHGGPADADDDREHERPQRTPAPTAPTREQIAPMLAPVGAHLVMPDVWFKLYFHALTVEFEGTGVFGKIDNPGPLSATPNNSLTLRAVRLGDRVRPQALSRFVLRRLRDRRRHRRPGGGPHAVPELPLQVRAAAARRSRHQRLQVLAGVPRRRDLLPPHPGHGDQRGLLQAAGRLLVRSAADAPAGADRRGDLQHGAGAGVDAGQRADVRHRDEPGRELPQHRRRFLRRPHLGGVLAVRRARSPGRHLGLAGTPPAPAPPRCCARSSASASSQAASLPDLLDPEVGRAQKRFPIAAILGKLPAQGDARGASDDESLEARHGARVSQGRRRDLRRAAGRGALHDRGGAGDLRLPRACW